jgi:hypothetical protein
MRLLKISALLILVLIGMRLLSWYLGWLLARIFSAGRRICSLVSNTAACSLYLALLYGDLMPGETVDTNAVFFGLAVFTAYAAMDLFWTPYRFVWRSRRSIADHPDFDNGVQSNKH